MENPRFFPTESLADVLILAGPYYEGDSGYTLPFQNEERYDGPSIPWIEVAGTQRRLWLE